MSLTTGSRLGPYEVVARVGAGGMGEVWRARDARIGRDVAVKVLPREFASDPDRLRRFEREARTIGALSHPNLLILHDIGLSEGSTYLVTEMLEGETLRDRIAQGALPIRKALECAAQVARGLAAAHAKGIVHRDLKPENLFVLKDGRVKILDFGLARTLPDRADAARPQSLTMSGVIVGTAGYMAPEQVRGESADHRADLFALGCVLYEMLTGARAFGGTEMVETMHAILHEEPVPIAERRPEVPASVAAVVQHCLEKDPAQRFQSAEDLAFALGSLAGTTTGLRPAGAVAPAGSRRPALIWSGGALLVLAVVALTIGLGRQPPPLPSFEQLTFRRGNLSNARFSPDGATIVYSAVWGAEPMRIYTTRTDSRESSPLPLPEGRLLAVSSAGELAIAIGGGGSRDMGLHHVLARVPLSGGAPREVAEDVAEADWSPDGRDLAIVREHDGRMSIEYPVGREIWRSSTAVHYPRVSPGGDQVAFVDIESGGDFTRGYVAVVDRQGRKRRLSTLWEDIQGIAWSPRGDEIWFTATHIGTAKQLRAVSLSGRERLLLQIPGGITLHDVARSGQTLLSQDRWRATLLARLPGEDRDRDLSWQDLTVVADLSTDGKQLLFTEFSEAYGSEPAIGMRGTDGSPVVNLGRGYAGGLSPDGKWVIAWERGPRKHLSLLPTGTGEKRDLEPGSVDDFEWSYWVPDGKRVVFGGSERDRGPRTYVQDISGGSPRAISPEGTVGGWHGVSPDGRYVVGAYRDSIYLFPLGGGTPRLIRDLSTGDVVLGWSADGRALLIRAARPPRFPWHVEWLDLVTGKRHVVRDLMPLDPAGDPVIWGVMFTPDLRGWAFSYAQTYSDLYLAHGLH